MLAIIQFVIDNWGSIATLMFAVSEILGKFNKAGIFSTIGDMMRPAAQKDVANVDQASAKVEDGSINPKK